MEAQVLHQLEQEAYTAVLRAFKAQADAISWEKESLITELRKELRVSDDEHRELLSMVNKEDTVQSIRDWRQGGGIQVPRHATIQPFDVVPGPTFSPSRKRQKTFQSHYPSVGATGNRTFDSRVVPGGISANQSAEALVGRKVWTRWLEDNHFYEALITRYNASEGLHALAYDVGLRNETWEWIDLKKIPPEDIRWDGEDSGAALNTAHRVGSFHGNRINIVRGGRGMGRTILSRREGFPPPTQQNPVGPLRLRRTLSDDIVLFNTDSLAKEVERVFDSAHPNPLELDKAKKMLKEQEQALIDAIAKLDDDTSDDGDPP